MLHIGKHFKLEYETWCPKLLKRKISTDGMDMTDSHNFF